MKKLLCMVMALLMCVSLITGCKSNENTSENDGVTEVSWYILGVKKGEVYDKVWARVNELMEERYGLRLNIVMTDSSNFAQKMKMMDAGREEYDLVFTSAGTNSYNSNVANGAYYDITDLLPEYAPTLWSNMSDAEKQAVTIKGRVYGVTNWQVQATATALSLVQDWVDEENLTSDDFNSVADMEKLLKPMVTKYPDRNKATVSWSASMPFYMLTTVLKSDVPGAVYIKENEKPVVINQYETPEFMQHAKMLYDWSQKGYISLVDGTKVDYNKKENLRSPGGPVPYKPGLKEQYDISNGYAHMMKQISPAIMSTETVCAAMTAVGANSKHPEAAVKVLEIVNTDKEIYNMLLYGIEGENYTKVDENTIRKNESAKYSISHWIFGSALNAYVVEGTPVNQWEETKKFNDSAMKSPLLGFTFDSDSVLSDVGNCETVLKEKLDNILNGKTNPETAVPELIKELKAAGSDRIIAEMQRQVDEWWKTK